jgi:hypothetical protein
MDMIEPLWTFAADIKVRVLILIVLAQMVLAVRLYSEMARQRFRAVKEGRVDKNVYKATQNEPEDVAVYSRVVTNQFEAPVLFFALIAMGFALNVTSWLTVVLALIFVILRWVHAAEMTGAHDVLRRRRIFLRSFQVLIVMMLEFAISAMLWA